MKKTLFIFLFAIPFFAIGQKTEYRIDEIKAGGFYLVESSTDTAGMVREFPQKFNTQEQLIAYVAYLRKQAQENIGKADKIEADAAADAKQITEKAADDAAKLRATSPLIGVAAAKIDAARAAFFDTNTTSIELPKKKTKPKKKKKE